MREEMSILFYFINFNLAFSWIFFETSHYIIMYVTEYRQSAVAIVEGCFRQFKCLTSSATISYLLSYALAH